MTTVTSEDFRQNGLDMIAFRRTASAFLDGEASLSINDWLDRVKGAAKEAMAGR